MAWSSLDGAGPFSLNKVPPGTWYLHAVALGARAGSGPAGSSPLLVGTVGPVQIGAHATTRLGIAVRQEDWTRPPVLLALPGFGPRLSLSPTVASGRPASRCRP
ncbi:hypothetical protein [Streptomyces sp. NBC_01618]|uniref:hypothetical protein n=1 Tax=Streptomyces sp. NBC_01618 TaxID=2975900 RepID=UPI0038650A65|nr:hypothetical protein OH735_30510 [Streptomyces sp. NBC_01618]